MLFEKRWAEVPTQLLTANGTVNGVLTIPDSRQLHVKQVIFLKSNTQVSQKLQVNRVLSETLIAVGPLDDRIFARSDVSAFLTADSASVYAEEQVRPKISVDEVIRAVFAEEPANAYRTLAVDEVGEAFNDENPLPTKGIQLFTKAFDAITATYPSATVEVYHSRTGGKLGPIQQVLTVTYVDATKELVQDIEVT